MSGALSVPFTAAALYVPNELLKALFVVLAILAAYGAGFFLWRDERKRVIEAEDRLRPQLVFLLENNCCDRGSLLAVGIGNPSAKTVDDASVYIDIPTLGVKNLSIAWMGMAAGMTIPIHHGELPRDHHHTAWIVIAGDQAGQFYLQTAYAQPSLISPGRYIAEVCVRGRDAITATARVEFVCELPRSLTARLLPTDTEDLRNAVRS